MATRKVGASGHALLAHKRTVYALQSCPSQCPSLNPLCRAGVNNYWLSSSLYKDNPSKRKRNDDFINSGDSLTLILKWLNVSNEDPARDLSYVLPTPLHPNGVRMNFEDTPKKRIMQLVPSVESMNCKECWERLGYWKIGVCNSAFQTADPQGKRDPKISIQSESASCIDMRFAPVWTSGYKNTDDTGSWRNVRNHDDGIIALPPPKGSPSVVGTGPGATQEPWKTIMMGQGWITEMEQKSAELQARGETLALSDQLILDAGLLSEKIYQACKEHSENALGTMKKIAIVNRSLRDALDAISRNTDEASSNAQRIVDRLVDIMALATSSPVVAGVEFDFNDVEMKNHIWDLPDVLNSQIKDMIAEALMVRKPFRPSPLVVHRIPLPHAC